MRRRFRAGGVKGSNGVVQSVRLPPIQAAHVEVHYVSKYSNELRGWVCGYRHTLFPDVEQMRGGRQRNR